MRKLINLALALVFAASTLAFVSAPASADRYDNHRCGRHYHWVDGHRDRWGHWIAGHCRHN